MTATPMMQQYHEAKASCPDALLLFRMGDFYELFHDDAKTAAAILNLTLTSRDKGENPTPMAGFPYHQLEAYLAKLISRGHRAAVCEQVEDPKQAKGIVRREVTRVVTPGTLTDDALLDPRANNYLAAILPGLEHQDSTQECGLAWVELSTGRFTATQVPISRLADELARIDPAECLWPESDSTVGPQGPTIAAGKFAVTRRPAWMFAWKAAQPAALKQWGVHSLEGFGFDEALDELAIRAAGALVQYLHETQKTSLAHLDRLQRARPGDSLDIDEFTRRSLELTRSMREGRREGTLLAVLDRTVTAMGARTLAEWVAAPLTNLAQIHARQDAIAELLHDPRLLTETRDHLRGIYDMERLLSRVTTGRASPRDLQQVAKTLKNLPPLKARLTARAAQLLNELEAQIDLCPELAGKLNAALADECPLALKDGGIIRPGYNTELDKLSELASGGKQWIAQYQAEELARTGISSLKVGFNKVFGYYIEVTNTHSAKIPPEYIRKQTVKNAERYITPALKEYEEQILGADDKAKALEYELFVELREMAAIAAKRLRGTALALAQLDVLASLADLARAQNYCRPQVAEDASLKIVAGRHPVVDAIAPAGTFVPNDTDCCSDAGFVLLITGPNMAGKSTYIRQVALITLLAQLGSFVPAKEATIGLTDRIFARVGASDELARGQSTFMVEMTETARILNTATARSLVILDEIGRGTSTYDGVSLAWGRDGVSARAHRLPHALCDALPRADRTRRAVAGCAELERRGARVG
jgi:DNA mismatch repair protein MutS